MIYIPEFWVIGKYSGAWRGHILCFMWGRGPVGPCLTLCYPAIVMLISELSYGRGDVNWIYVGLFSLILFLVDNSMWPMRHLFWICSVSCQALVQASKFDSKPLSQQTPKPDWEKLPSFNLPWCTASPHLQWSYFHFEIRHRKINRPEWTKLNCVTWV